MNDGYTPAVHLPKPKAKNQAQGQVINYFLII